MGLLSCGKEKDRFLFLKRRPFYPRRLLEHFHTMPSIGHAFRGWEWYENLKTKAQLAYFCQGIQKIQTKVMYIMSG